MPTFTFTILQSSRGCLSWQVVEAIRIHFSRNALLNSKNGYIINHLAMVEEDAYNKMKRARQEKMEEVMEQKLLLYFLTIRKSIVFINLIVLLSAKQIFSPISLSFVL
jgi:hypothetical protein